MKVIKKGREQRGWAMEKICDGHGFGGGGCGARVLVEEDDVYATSRGDGEGGNEYFRTFRCCECGVQNNFKTSEASPVWDRTNRKEGDNRGDPANGFTYSSKQATECAVCGERKHTPLRNDAMGGYVCLTCISNELLRLQENDGSVLCSHANEVPNVCPCPPECACRLGICGDKK